MNRSVVVVAVLSIGLLSGCPGEQVASCQSLVVAHPEGKCSAYYYQADYRSGGQTTQALVECAVSEARPGGTVVAFHSVAHGIGLRWLDPHSLEVAVPSGVTLQDQRTSATYAGYPLRYVYRELSESEQAFRGCGLGGSRGGT